MVLAHGAALYREKEPEETLDDYREALAAHVEAQDPLMAQEVRLGLGWDKWTDRERAAFALDHYNTPYGRTTPLIQGWYAIHRDLFDSIRQERTREAGAVGAGEFRELFRKEPTAVTEARMRRSPPIGFDEAMAKAKRFGGQGKLRRFGKDGKEIKDDPDGSDR
jgi:hypothetical protein